jgi:hypothetical protein
VIREYAVLAAFAVVLTVATFMALQAFRMSCDYFFHGEVERFLCRHHRLRLGVSLFCYLGLAVYLSRKTSATVREVARGCAVPMAAAAYLAYEWTTVQPELARHFRGGVPLVLGLLIAMVSVFACRRRTPSGSTGDVTSRRTMT